MTTARLRADDAPRPALTNRAASTGSSKGRILPTLLFEKYGPAVQNPSTSQTQLSLAKDKIEVLLLEGVNDSALAQLRPRPLATPTSNGCRRRSTASRC